jgi:hypothetical protein
MPCVVTSTCQVDCSEAGCNQGNLMHRECYDSFENEVLHLMRNTGRAKMWSEEQRR